MNNVVSLQIIEKSALGLYVLAGTKGRAADFIEALSEETRVPVLKLLHELFSTPNANQSEYNAETNRLAAPIVQSRIDKLLGAA